MNFDIFFWCFGFDVGLQIEDRSRKLSCPKTVKKASFGCFFRQWHIDFHHFGLSA